MRTWSLSMIMHIIRTEIRASLELRSAMFQRRKKITVIFSRNLFNADAWILQRDFLKACHWQMKVSYWISISSVTAILGVESAMLLKWYLGNRKKSLVKEELFFFQIFKNLETITSSIGHIGCWGYWSTGAPFGRMDKGSELTILHYELSHLKRSIAFVVLSWPLLALSICGEQALLNLSGARFLLRIERGSIS